MYKLTFFSRKFNSIGSNNVDMNQNALSVAAYLHVGLHCLICSLFVSMAHESSYIVKHVEISRDQGF